MGPVISVFTIFAVQNLVRKHVIGFADSFAAS